MKAAAAAQQARPAAAAEAKRIAYRLDQQAVLARARQARADRYVRLRPAGDGMATVSVRLPAAEGQVVHTALSDGAATTLASMPPGTSVPAGLGRTHGQIMADLVVERVTGRNPIDTPVSVTVNLVLSDETLLAGGAEPAYLQGYGPVPAELARTLLLAAEADPEAAASVRRVYAQPGSNKLVAMESAARVFPRGLARFIALRDQICRTPFCNARIRHTDHVKAHGHRGRTEVHNGQGVCEQCNYVQAEPGWQAAATYDRHGRHTVTPDHTHRGGLYLHRTTRARSATHLHPRCLHRAHPPRGLVAVPGQFGARNAIGGVGVRS